MDNLLKRMRGITLKNKKKNPTAKIAPKATKKAVTVRKTPNLKKALRIARKGNNFSREVIRAIENKLLVIMPKIIKKVKSDIKAVKKAKLDAGFLEDNLEAIQDKFDILKYNHEKGIHTINNMSDLNEITEDVLKIIEFTGDYKKSKVGKMAVNNAAAVPAVPAAAPSPAIANLSPNSVNSDDNLENLVGQIKKAAI